MVSVPGVTTILDGTGVEVESLQETRTGRRRNSPVIRRRILIVSAQAEEERKPLNKDTHSC